MWRLEGGQGQVSLNDVLVNQSGQAGEAAGGGGELRIKIKVAVIFGFLVSPIKIFFLFIRIIFLIPSLP